MALPIGGILILVFAVVLILLGIWAVSKGENPDAEYYDKYQGFEDDEDF